MVHLVEQMEAARVRTVPLPLQTRRISWLPDTLSGFGYVGIPLLLLIAFFFYPLARSIQLSLYATNPLGNASIFVGLEQYQQLIESGDFVRSLVVTLLFTLYVVPLGIVLSLGLAVLANQRLRGVAIFRAIFSSSIGIGVVSATLVWSILFNPGIGLLNYIVGFLHIPPQGWLTNPNTALPSLAVFTIWTDLGFNVIVLLGGLQQIPADLYEAVAIDGANPWQRFRNVTVPMLSPSLFFLLVVSTISALQTFAQVQVTTKGGPAGATNTIVFKLYREAFFNFHLGLASAIGVLLFAFVLVLTLMQFRLLESRVHYQ